MVQLVNPGPRRIRIVPPFNSCSPNTRAPRVTMTLRSRMRSTRTLRIRGINGRQCSSSASDRAISEGQIDSAGRRLRNKRKISDLRASSLRMAESSCRDTRALFNDVTRIPPQEKPKGRECIDIRSQRGGLSATCVQCELGLNFPTGE
jgi:hypothetical protein